MSAIPELGTDSFVFPKRFRLVKSADFGKLLTIRDGRAIRVSSQFFSVTVVTRNKKEGPIRIGITVGKKNAHRSVDRALVKRVLRETARKQAPYLIALLCETEVGLDVSLRLKISLLQIPESKRGVNALKKVLSQDAASLQLKLRKRLIDLKVFHSASSNVC